MKYTIDFNEDAAKVMFKKLCNYYDMNRYNVQSGDVMRSATTESAFEQILYMLDLFGCVTDFGSYNDNKCLKIGYASINNIEFVKNGEMLYGELKEALKAIVEGNTERLNCGA